MGALKQINVSPKDFAQAVLVQKAIAACGATPETFAKILMIQNQLYKRGANCRDIAVSLKELGDFESKKEATHASILQAIKEEKLQKNDVFMNVRMAQALDNENDTNWKEVKGMKDILQGCSPNSPEAISLNLARATKTGGLNKHDIAACLTAQKVMATIGVDPKILAQITNIEKVIAQNGVPAVEIARVLQDGSMPAEVIEALASLAEPELGKTINGTDVDCFVKFFDNLKLKANIPEEVIEFIDKKLIQVRCSLEDVADNMVGTKLAMGAKEAQVTRDLCETLRKTGASAEITCTTMHGALKKVVNKADCDIMKDVGRAVVEDGNYPSDDVTKAMTEVCLNILEDDIQLREEAYKAMEIIMKDAGAFPTEIREYLDGALPPEPPRPPSPRLVAELERLKAEDEAREAEAARKALEGSSSSGEEFSGELVDAGGKPKSGKPKNKMLDAVTSDSRRGSLVPPGSRRGSRQGSISLAGTERRGSYYGDDVSKRATVAVVVDGEGPKSLNGEGGVVNGQESGLGPEACESPEESRKALLAKIRNEGMSEDDVAKLMSVFDNQGVLTKIGGVRKFRKISDVNSAISGVDKAFGDAIDGAKRQSKKSSGAGLSDENRKLMESILAKSVQDQYEIGSRVATLLAGTSLTTTAGVDVKRRDPVEQIGYETVDGLGKLTKRRVDTYTAPRKIEIPKVTVQDIPRPSIQRQSQSLHRLRKLSEQQREADKKREEEKRITGLRRAKVPLMVYSCGGFTRCFRIARFYDVDGPPIGIKYDAETRAALNPDLNVPSVAKSEES